MTKNFAFVNEYEAPPTAIFEMLTNPDFRKSVLKKLEVVRYDAIAEKVNGTPLLRIQVTDDTGPGALLLGAKQLTVELEERWPTTESATLTASAPGQPLSIDALIVLTSDGNRTRESITGKVSYKKFGLGGLVESFVVNSLLSEIYEAERALGEAWLERR